MPELPPQLSIGLTIHEAEGKRHYTFPCSRTGHTSRRGGKSCMPQLEEKI